MFYLLHQFSDSFRGFNVFKYETFRAISAAMTSFLLCLIFGDCIIRKLISLKIGQPIRTKEEVHKLAELHDGKKGTPTMGGVMLLGATVISTLLWANPKNIAVWIVLFATFTLGMLGFADDYFKVTKKKSDGISGKTKLAVQCAVGAVVTAFFVLNPATEIQARTLYAPFFKGAVIANMGFFTLIFSRSSSWAPRMP